MGSWARYPDSIWDVSRTLMKMLSGLISAMVRQFHGTFERGGMVSSTCVDDFVLMGEIEGAHKLKGELSHEECRDSIVREPDTKGRQGLAHELEDETHVRAVGPCELKVVDQVADVFVAQELAASIAEPTEDLSLEDGMFMAVAFVTQDFEGPEAMLVVWPGNFRRGWRRRRALNVLFREVLDQPNRRISSPSKLARTCLHRRRRCRRGEGHRACKHLYLPQCRPCQWSSLSRHLRRLERCPSRQQLPVRRHPRHQPPAQP